ncbi:MAG: DUF748 domain-containing protein [Candidatus Omnitrophica bacterium]|nr:DUF748 domain-containing protein [Candidatus Omnitrophota bacterium]
MLIKILRISAKVIVSLFLFYVIAGFIIIPLVLTWAIPSQGTKFLKHPVLVRSVALNPFLWQLTIKDFQILDLQKQEMLGFDKLFIDVSFIDFLKKIYHVEAFELDGLKVNVELLSGGQINLLELVPSGAPAPKAPAEVKTTSVVEKPAPLPVVIIDSITLHHGQIRFTDKAIKPNFITTLGAMELLVTHITTDPQTEAKVKFQAYLDDKGRISTETIIKPLSMPLAMETAFSLNDYALEVLTPYVGKYTGRELRSGKMDLTLDYRISDNKLVASHKLLIQRFEFGNNVDSKDALHLPFGLAVALLEDPQGKISIALPAAGDMSDPKFEYTHLIFQVIRNFFLNLVTKPFSFLGSMLGASGQGTDELGYVRFSPGRTDLSDSQKQKLRKLINGLKTRPKLHLEIDGSYDPQVDWKAIQADAFTKDYEQLRKDSSRSEGKVYQLLYQRRFGIRALWALAKKYKEGVGNYNDSKLDQEIKRQLIENAPPDLGHLSVLAQTRAGMAHDFFISCGLDAQRLTIGPPHSTQSSMGYVPMEFTLTVFDKT